MMVDTVQQSTPLSTVNPIFPLRSERSHYTKNVSYSYAVNFLTRSHFQLCSARIKAVFLCETIGFIMCAQIRANAETNCCCCSLALRRDAPSALHCA